MNPAAKAAFAASIAICLSGCGTTAPLTTTVTGQGGLDGQFSDAPFGAAEAVDGIDSEAVSGLNATGSSRGNGGVTSGRFGARTGSGGSSGNASKGPIKVGVLSHDFTALVKAVGGSATTDGNALARALIKGLNARGGLAGRRIDPVFYTVDGSASDYSSQYQAACDTFTRDDRVEVVVGGGAADILYSCLLKAGIGVIAGIPTEGTDRQGMRAFPNVFNPPGMATDRQAATLIAQSVAHGWLSSKNRLGVILSGCAWGPRVYNRVIVPAARKHRIAVEQFSLGCPTPGSASLSEYSSAVQSAALQFRGNGVDRVMFAAGHGDAASYVFFTRNADSQRWYPGYLAGTNAVVQGWTSSGVVSRDQAANTRGIGWIPVVDDSRTMHTDQTRACVDIAKAGGAPPPPDQPTAGNYYLLCDALLPLRAAVEATGGAAGLAVLKPALEALGDSYGAASVVGGATLLTADRHDGARLAAFYSYLQECSCFRYTGKPQPA